MILYVRVLTPSFLQTVTEFYPSFVFQRWVLVYVSASISSSFRKIAWNARFQCWLWKTSLLNFSTQSYSSKRFCLKTGEQQGSAGGLLIQVSQLLIKASVDLISFTSYAFRGQLFLPHDLSWTIVKGSPETHVTGSSLAFYTCPFFCLTFLSVRLTWTLFAQALEVFHFQCHFHIVFVHFLIWPGSLLSLICPKALFPLPVMQPDF